MLVKTYSAAVMGLEATTITIEVSINRGVQFHLTGLADTAASWPPYRTTGCVFPLPTSP